MDTPDIQRIQHAIATSLHDHRMLFVVEGTILVVLGLTAMVVPLIATLVIEDLFGWLFLISGVTGLIATLWIQRATGFWWSVVSATLGVAAGATLLLRPLTILSLSVVLIVFFAIESVASIALSLEYKRRSEQWGWMLASGIIDLILFVIGTTIMAGSPRTAELLLGFLLGISLMSGGGALVAMALGTRS